jgi:integrase/recombinase XerD
MLQPDRDPDAGGNLNHLRREGHAGGALFRSVSDSNHGAHLSIWSWSKTVRRWAA